MDGLVSIIISKANYWGFIILMLIGLYAMIVKNNLFKKIIGMSIFQTAIILFYISIACKKGGKLPIIAHGYGHDAHAAINAAEYLNPLPHVLMLTAIVVGVATLGVALALALKIYRRYNTLEEDEIKAQIKIQ